MDTGLRRHEQYLPLRLAAVLVHIQVTGKPPSATDPLKMRATLDDVARALAMMATIYTCDEQSGLPAKIEDSVVIRGTFTRGATVLVGVDGIKYEHLAVRRADMESAGEILRSSSKLRELWAAD